MINWLYTFNKLMNTTSKQIQLWKPEFTEEKWSYTQVYIRIHKKIQYLSCCLLIIRWWLALPSPLQLSTLFFKCPWQLQRRIGIVHKLKLKEPWEFKIMKIDWNKQSTKTNISMPTPRHRLLINQCTLSTQKKKIYSWHN